MPEVFLDTAYAIALSSSSDRYHGRAVELAERLETSAARMVTTQAVLLRLAMPFQAPLPPGCGAVVDSNRNRPQRGRRAADGESVRPSLRPFRARPDKEWGLIDCVSFVVMSQRGIVNALTTDEHFQQMGFRALLRD